MALLSVENLQTHFGTQDGVVRSVEGLSFHIDAGETVLQGGSDYVKPVGRLDFSGEPVAALAKAALGRHRKATSSTDDTSMFEAKEAGAPVNKNFTRLSSMPLVHLKRWLQLVENSILTDTNLRTVMVRGDTWLD